MERRNNEKKKEEKGSNQGLMMRSCNLIHCLHDSWVVVTIIITLSDSLFLLTLKTYPLMQGKERERKRRECRERERMKKTSWRMKIVWD